MRFVACAFFVACAAACSGDPACAADDDCVAASCCHSKDAVHVDLAPICGPGCTDEFVVCSDDDPEVVPVCELGVCKMRRPAWCPAADVLRGR